MDWHLFGDHQTRVKTLGCLELNYQDKLKLESESCGAHGDSCALFGQEPMAQWKMLNIATLRSWVHGIFVVNRRKN